MHKQLNHKETERLQHTLEVAIICDNIILPANIGMIYRIADAMGIKEIHLCGNAEVLNSKKVLKASRSTSELIPTYKYESTQEPLELLKSKGFEIIALELTSTSIDLRDFTFPETKIAIVVGAENFGVSPESLSSSNKHVHIPMFGNNSSMNVATALSIFLFELIRQLS